MTFTFVVNFRGGTYCSQVEAIDVHLSLYEWTKEIFSTMNEIKYLGKKTIEQIKNLIADSDYEPVKLTGLKNIWYASYFTKKGVFSVNIIQTDISGVA